MTILDVPRPPLRDLPPGAKPAKTYSSRTQTYNLKAKHLRRFRAKAGAASAGVGLAKIACVGDSKTCGTNGTNADYKNVAWPSVLRNLLATSGGYVMTGTGWVNTNSGQSDRDSRWTMTNWGGTGVSSPIYTVNVTSGATAVFASDKAGTVAEFKYLANGTPFTVAIDGGSATTVTPANSNTITTWQGTGLANTTHTITITATTTGGLFLGQARVRGTTGVDLTNFGVGGSTAAGWAGSIGDANGILPQVITYAPDLTLISLRTNDANGGIAASAYQASMSTLIDQVTAISDVVLIADTPMQGNDLLPFQNALYTLADAKDLPVIDLHDRWGSWTSANGFGLYYDGLHPNASGYFDCGQAVFRALLGGG